MHGAISMELPLRTTLVPLHIRKATSHSFTFADGQIGYSDVFVCQLSRQQVMFSTARPEKAKACGIYVYHSCPNLTSTILAPSHTGSLCRHHPRNAELNLIRNNRALLPILRVDSAVLFPSLRQPLHFSTVVPRKRNHLPQFFSISSIIATLRSAPSTVIMFAARIQRRAFSATARDVRFHSV